MYVYVYVYIHIYSYNLNPKAQLLKLQVDADEIHNSPKELTWQNYLGAARKNPKVSAKCLNVTSKTGTCRDFCCARFWTCNQDRAKVETPEKA